jgi:hypothetical protein
MDEVPMNNLDSLAQCVAAHLSGNWTPHPRGTDWIAEIRGPNDSAIYLERSKGRLVITGRFPSSDSGIFVPLYADRPRITVRANRPPKDIAGEIERRFLPEYLPLYREMWMLCVGYRQAEMQRREHLALLAEAAGSEVLHDSVRWYGEHGGRIEVRHDGRVKMEIDTTVEVALKIVEILKEQAS